MDPNNFFLKTLIDTPKFSTQMIKDAHVVYKDHQTKLLLSNPPLNSILSRETLTSLEKCGLLPTGLRIFIWQPNQFNLWHIDGAPKQLINFSLNWVISGAGEIQWNKEIKGLADNDVAYGSIESSSSDEYEISTFGHQCLINTSIPHRVVTDGMGRLSVCLCWDTNSSVYSFEEAGQRLKSVGLIS